jgi:hypothetical protein
MNPEGQIICYENGCIIVCAESADSDAAPPSSPASDGTTSRRHRFPVTRAHKVDLR